MNRGRKRQLITPKTAPYYFLAPAIILIAVFTIYPVISSFILSFQGMSGTTKYFVGLDNYKRLIGDDVFFKALRNTFTILVFQVPVMLSLALLIAVGLNSRMIKFRGIFRTVYFLPSITALVAASVIFLIVLDGHYGLANYILSLIGIAPIDWLNEPIWARISIMLVMTWRWTGYNMVIFLAGLQNISEDLYEAASIDGAGAVRKFFSITLPLLKPIFFFTVVTSTIGTLQLFDEAYILTNGGPNGATMTLTLYLYTNGFTYFDFGYASALAYVLVIILAAISWVQMKAVGDSE